MKNSKRKRNFKPKDILPLSKGTGGTLVEVEKPKLPTIVGAAAAQMKIAGDLGRQWTIITIEKPARHMDIRKELKRIGQNDFQIEKQWEMGFITNEGKFLNRREALGLVENNGQIEIGKNDSPAGLISDDLW